MTAAAPVLPSHILGGEAVGGGDGFVAVNAVSQQPIVTVNSDGFDFGDIVDYGRRGGAALRAMTFHQRANRISALAKRLNAIKQKYYAVSAQTGATRRDSQVDIDGGINTLFAVASLARRGLPDARIAYESGYDQLSADGGFVGKHLLAPKPGVAVLINAFNFPCWGMLEKLACAFIAGMPAIIKPASVSAYVAEAMMRDIVDSQILPAGSAQMVCGGLGDTLARLTEMDMVSFTGSADTARQLRRLDNLLDNSIPFCAETDSLNFALLSQHSAAGDGEFVACADEIARELTTKAGQRCTCIRRVFVHESQMESLADAVMQKLNDKIIGDPQDDAVGIGALVSRAQQRAAQEAVESLLVECEIYATHQGDIQSAYAREGAFFRPQLLVDSRGLSADRLCHQIEAFGPVATLAPYRHTDDAIAAIAMAKGSLTGTLYSDNADEIADVVGGVAAWHGRLNIVNAASAAHNPGHGTVMPHMVHGGPGRAGGGEELGGVRGIKRYLQRVGVQGAPAQIGALCGDWPAQAATDPAPCHPFRIAFDDLRIGQGMSTAARTVTEADIVAFANLSWDHFYAHTDDPAARRSFFGARVAHGYFVLSATAGLFVDPAEGPVLANLGIEQLRFLAPVFIGDTIRARLTCKEKTVKPQRDNKMPPAGEVKWHVQTLNQKDEVVVDYIILTLVRRR